MRGYALVLVAVAAIASSSGAAARQSAAVAATALAAGEQSTCALTATGRVECWGFFGDARALSPVGISGLDAGATAIAAGGLHACAVTATGAAVCWGQNPSGVLGDGTTVASATPVEVRGLGGPVTAIATGFSHACALTAAGGVKCWGQSGAGRLGDGTTTDRPTPVDVSGQIAVEAGGGHTCALAASGAISCWGDGRMGQLGTGTWNSSTTPGAVVGFGRPDP